ncbi:hypothetical protein GCM10025868_27350 [Angustibacter aerolatus]|uniref:Uncharacterized protein n=1 Tax=Angustibacter aerolatus TaxID=1162965 RepID=A0ABQ6JJR8_9ACTN|nr:hypothetical protein GCM10025868_27350 [Angustibacter aerolatus]
MTPVTLGREWATAAQATRAFGRTGRTDPTRLAVAVALIRERGTGDHALVDTGEEDEYEAPEGRVLYRQHRRYERDRTLVARKKAAVRKQGLPDEFEFGGQRDAATFKQARQRGECGRCLECLEGSR